jgi:hypothetical protein
MATSRAQALAGNVAEVEALLGESERERKNLKAKYIELAAKARARTRAQPACRGPGSRGVTRGCAARAPLNPPEPFSKLL